MAGRAATSLDVRLRPARLLSDGAAALYVVLMSGAIVPPLLARDGAGSIDLETGLPTLQVAMAVVLVCLSVRFALYFWRRPVTQYLRHAWLPLLFLCLALLSSTWSIDPVLTLRRSVALGGTVLVALFLAGVVGYRRSVTMITLLLGAIALGSLLVALLFPELGVHQSGAHVGRWKGLYLHKNLLGREMALASGLFLIASMKAKRYFPRLLWGLFVVLALYLIVMTQSTTGLLASLCVLLAVSALVVASKRPIVAVVVMVLGLAFSFALGLLLELSPSDAANLVGRDLSLTGRTAIWNRAVSYLAERPVIGHGYRAFWANDPGDSISGALGYRVAHGHNGWLDAGLDLGLLGVVSMGLLVSWVYVRWWRDRWEYSRFYLTGSTVVTCSLAVSVSDSVLLGPNNLFLLLVILHLVQPCGSDKGDT